MQKKKYRSELQNRYACQPRQTPMQPNTIDMKKLQNRDKWIENDLVSNLQCTTSFATLQSKRLRRRVITRLLQRFTLPFIYHLRLFAIRPRKRDLHKPISTFLFLSKQKDCIKRQARENMPSPQSQPVLPSSPYNHPVPTPKPH